MHEWLYNVMSVTTHSYDLSTQESALESHLPMVAYLESIYVFHRWSAS